MAQIDLTDEIQQAAQEPKRVRVDGQEAEAQDLDDLIAAQRFCQQQEAAKKPHRGLRFTKLVPPGAP